MKKYSWLDVSLLVNGVPVGGMDEGDDVVTVARVANSVNYKVGIDGEMTISPSANRAGSVRFRVMQTSDSNTFLSALISAQENDAFVPVAVLMRDAVGNDLVTGAQGFLTKPADMVRGENANAQEWEIIVENLVMVHRSPV